MTRASAKDKYVIGALEIIAEDGLDALSLREVARRLGVSHQAPYRHFPTRDHVIAELIRRSFIEFSDGFRQVERTGDPFADLRTMGHAYLDFAENRPLQYELMFGTMSPQGSEHTEMRKESFASFGILLEAIAAIRRSRSASTERRVLEADALFVWASLHGFVELQRKMDHSEGPMEFQGREMREELLDRIETALRSTKS